MRLLLYTTAVINVDNSCTKTPAAATRRHRKSRRRLRLADREALLQSRRTVPLLSQINSRLRPRAEHLHGITIIEGMNIYLGVE
jgi:hypothetical protein